MSLNKRMLTERNIEAIFVFSPLFLLFPAQNPMSNHAGSTDYTKTSPAQ
jgi:hypothetical protein